MQDNAKGVYEGRRSKISRRQLSRCPPGFEKADRGLWFELEQVQELPKWMSGKLGQNQYRKGTWDRSEKQKHNKEMPYH